MNSRRRRRSALGSVTAILIPLAAILIFWLVTNQRSSATTPRVATELDELTVVRGYSAPDTINIPYTGFNVTFVPRTHIPQYVSWVLTADHTDGPNGRTKFATDPYVVGSADPQDYTRSGYDRGHMAPAADFKWSREAMTDCFYMTNIAPQHPYLNQHPWQTLEKKCRQRADRDSAVVIITGPVPGEEPLGYIGANRIPVPRRYFKVVLSPYADPPMSVGFVMPNSADCPGMQQTAMTVDEVEKITGYDFFSALPDDIEDTVESTDCYLKWSNIRP